MSEVRLIDANALKEELLKDKYISWDCEYAVTHEDIKKVIDNAPTINPYADSDSYDAGYWQGVRDTERPKGEWETYLKPSSTGRGLTIGIKCPFCGYEVDEEYAFCVCGADMRGKKE